MDIFYQPKSCAPCTEKVTRILKKFKKVACHQFVAPLGYETAAVLKKQQILRGNSSTLLKSGESRKSCGSVEISGLNIVYTAVI
jgi:hypothetical protein